MAIKKKSKTLKSKTQMRTTEERQTLKKIGLQINYDLQNSFKESRTVEWLSWESSTARSTIMEIVAGRSNFQVLTLLKIAKALKYKTLTDFLDEALN